MTPSALADVATAQGVLLVALMRSRLRPTGHLVAPVPDDGRASGPADRAVPEREDATLEQGATVERAIRAIDRASRRGLFRPTCLVRSLALLRLLERWGVPGARIRIGVRPTAPLGAGTMTEGRTHGSMLTSGGGPRADGGTPAAPSRPAGPPPRATLRAHAWVELEGRVIGDDPRHVARFTPLGSVTSVPLRWR